MDRFEALWDALTPYLGQQMDAFLPTLEEMRAEINSAYDRGELADYQWRVLRSRVAHAQNHQEVLWNTK